MGGSRTVRVVAAMAAAMMVAISTGPAGAQRTAAWPHEGSDIQPDARIVFGQLPNGMRYAIMPNQSPPGLISVRLRIAAGSMHEAPGQEGLAHMLEHLAFRGSKAFPGHEGIKKKLQDTGLTIGQSFNAYTAPHETGYSFDIAGASTERVGAVLDVVEEILGGLELSAEGLEAERGIVLAEERQRDTPASRSAAAGISAALGDHPFGQMPIGLTDVLQTAPVERVRAFYDEYYRPERALLVIVGPVDPANLEPRIRERFSDVQGRGRPGSDPQPLQTTRGGAERIVTHVREGAPNQVSLMWAHGSKVGARNKAAAAEDLLEQVAVRVLTARMQAAARGGAMLATAERGELPGVARITTLTVARPTTPAAGAAALALAHKQALETPVTQEEFDLALNKMRSEAKDAAGSRLIGTRIIASSLIASVSAGEIYLTAAQSSTLLEELAPTLTPARADAAMRRLFEGQAPVLFVSNSAPVEGGEAALRTALADGRRGSAQALAQIENKPWPYETFGPPGAVAESREDPLGVTMVRFANNVRLTIKPNRARADQIQVRVLFGSGLLDYPRDAQSAGRLWTRSLVQGGLVGLSNAERQRAMQGRSVNVFAAESEGGFILGGNTTAADFDQQMQLLAAYMTAPAWKVDDFEAVKASVIQGLDQTEASARSVYSARSPVLLRSGDQRWASPSREFLQGVTLQQVREFFEPILQSSEMEVVIVGNITPERAIEATAKTFGAFSPRRPLREPPNARQVRFPAPQPDPVVLTHKGRPDQALAAVAWPTSDFYSAPGAELAAQVLHQVFRERLFEELRSRQGKTYSVDGVSDFSRVFTGYGVFRLEAELPPEAMADFFAAAEKIAADLRANELAQGEIDRVVRSMRQQLSITTLTDAYWSTILPGVHREPRRLESARDPIGQLASVTPASVKAAAQTWLTPDGAFKLTVLPEAGAGQPGAPQPISPSRLTSVSEY